MCKLFRKIKIGDVVDVRGKATRVIVRDIKKEINEDTKQWYIDYWNKKGVGVETEFDTIIGVSFPRSPNRVYGFPKPLVHKKWFQFYHKADLKETYNLEEKDFQRLQSS